MESDFFGDAVANLSQPPASALGSHAEAAVGARRSTHLSLFLYEGEMWQLPLTRRRAESACEERDHIILRAVYGASYESLTTLSDEGGEAIVSVLYSEEGAPWN